MQNSFPVAVPRPLLDKFLRKMVPLATSTVTLFEENAESNGLPPGIARCSAIHQVDSWAEAYEDLSSFLGLHLAALSTLDKPPSVLFSPPAINTPEDLQSYLDAVWQEVEETLDDDSDDAIQFVADERANEPWALAGLDDEGKPITRQRVFLTVSLVICFNYFSCMVHRKSLFQLVAEAKAGDDESLLKAIQIDKRCLTDIGYFRERVSKATRLGDTKLLSRVANYQAKPVFQSGTVLSSLYLIFSLLDAIGLLDAYAADEERFADFCQSLGAYGPDNDAVDTDSFSRTLRRFRKQYQTLSVRPKIALTVKDTN